SHSRAPGGVGTGRRPEENRGMSRAITTRIEKLEAELRTMPPSEPDVEDEAVAMAHYWLTTVPDLAVDLALAWCKNGISDFDLAHGAQLEAPACYHWWLKQCLTWCYLVHGRWDIAASTELGRAIRQDLDRWIPLPLEMRLAWLAAADGTPFPRTTAARQTWID